VHGFCVDENLASHRSTAQGAAVCFGKDTASHSGSDLRMGSRPTNKIGVITRKALLVGG
jgi:hypothetical protein